MLMHDRLCANVEITVTQLEINFVCLFVCTEWIQASVNCYFVSWFEWATHLHLICVNFIWFFYLRFASSVYVYRSIKMLKRNLILLNVCMYVITVVFNIDNVHATRCSRIPEGSSNNYRSISKGNFRIRIQDDSSVYKPGRTYTGWWFAFAFAFVCKKWIDFIFIALHFIVRIERNSNMLKGRDQVRQTFTGFYLAVERKRNSSSDVAEVRA